MDRICLRARDVRRMDRYCIDTLGIPAAILMENAARGVADAIIARTAPCRTAVLAGRGNNGGDGLAVARHLLSAGYEVTIYNAGSGAGSEETEQNRRMAEALNIPQKTIPLSALPPALTEEINSAPLLVDAVFGAGFRLPLRAEFLPLAESLAPRGTVFAIDVPSGIDGDTGQGRPLCRAHFTVTIHAPKPGLWLYPGRAWAGEVITADLRVPYLPEERPSVRLKESFCIPPRDPMCYKGSFPHVGIVGGRLGMTGAGILAAKSALCCGAGLVSVAAPAAYAHIFEQQVAEAMTCPILASDALGYLDAAEELKAFARGKTALVIGPGLGRDRREMVTRVLTETPCSMVVDADALWCIGKDPGLLADIGPRSIFTPHYGEMSYLTGLSIEEIKADKVGVAADFADRYNTCLVLKGPDTVVARPGAVSINTSGCPAMAGPGFGDTLCGMIAAGASSPEDMVYLHGLAGERAAADRSETCVTAEDIIRYIPVCIKERSNV
ncbi:MAG: NAD(P)H-hydrate dehydratase [Abditibacteriota bacterium]|nr:NAD(P)H-hydrate dehydratase [Abditibacteriota bacterium]